MAMLTVMSRAIAVFALFVLGCSDFGQDPSPCDRTFHASPDLMPYERSALNRANARWNAIAIEQYCIDDDMTAKDHLVTHMKYGSPEWLSATRALGTAPIGVHYTGTNDIAILEGLSEETVELVELQELGHAHGLSHTPPPAIMHVTSGTATDFTDIDLAECHRVGACK